jgi:hypothetical protein
MPINVAGDNGVAAANAGCQPPHEPLIILYLVHMHFTPIKTQTSAAGVVLGCAICQSGKSQMERVSASVAVVAPRAVEQR